MFHVEHETQPDSSWIDGALVRVFGDRVELAQRYHASLSTDGVERGLIGPREVPRLWERHLLNCAVVGELIPDGASVVDVGSGAGLPGIPLAIARPDLTIFLVEPLLRRTVYLAEIVEALGLSVTVVRGRAEQPGVIKEAGGCDVVTSRAVAPLEKLARWSLPLVHERGVMLALKGSTAQEEIDRDKGTLTRIGAKNLEVLQCGQDVVPTPTIVVRAERAVRGARVPKFAAGSR
ncbi:16S rRNA (guanine(527)-N(7))-methyltransferase RsmG [Rhodococcus sp. Leaf7]|uniref:16S rRNA (guanine(527)-N(7))-methyltransferase RsmG n=1 Tax=unclassified Rhodococcus (in: high G+C Gram-positive bacteria) TaxID=192944 RepID=UPI0005AD1A6E|nr:MULTISPECIES: 16S rRNA (guanine(527)-N(7))-methyltransferase RsmG [unclassified Rhodococcus (in: high G+C Gram-positive bacteria)]KIQ19357.1 ribosomal RNA small subunit methyltransferase G [Rhodococcus sp. MEB064]KQU04584.1 16S rRNA (guanine(527)-N(7))-methyltransferase RsmG [Rhodococcus sp. Leaf7]KQU40770.1 16S rRNA (guanine(527)-N(7))-methyltransferase RsmG [Rhodococcus sp. Leaf247]